MSTPGREQPAQRGAGGDPEPPPQLSALKIIYFLQFLTPGTFSCLPQQLQHPPPGLDGFLMRCLDNSLCTKTPCIPPSSTGVLDSAGGEDDDAGEQLRLGVPALSKGADAPLG